MTRARSCLRRSVDSANASVINNHPSASLVWGLHAPPSELAVIQITKLFAVPEEAWYLVAGSACLSQQRAAITAMRIMAVQAQSLYNGPVLPHG
jgi:hypothetical protein